MKTRNISEPLDMYHTFFDTYFSEREISNELYEEEEKERLKTSTSNILILTCLIYLVVMHIVADFKLYSFYEILTCIIAIIIIIIIYKLLVNNKIDLYYVHSLFIFALQINLLIFCLIIIYEGTQVHRCIRIIYIDLICGSFFFVFCCKDYLILLIFSFNSLFMIASIQISQKIEFDMNMEYFFTIVISIVSFVVKKSDPQNSRTIFIQKKKIENILRYFIEILSSAQNYCFLIVSDDQILYSNKNFSKLESHACSNKSEPNEKENILKKLEVHKSNNSINNISDNEASHDSAKIDEFLGTGILGDKIVDNEDKPESVKKQNIPEPKEARDKSYNDNLLFGLSHKKLPEMNYNSLELLENIVNEDNESLLSFLKEFYKQKAERLNIKDSLVRKYDSPELNGSQIANSTKVTYGLKRTNSFIGKGNIGSIIDCDFIQSSNKAKPVGIMKNKTLKFDKPTDELKNSFTSNRSVNLPKQKMSNLNSRNSLIFKEYSDNKHKHSLKLGNLIKKPKEKPYLTRNFTVNSHLTNNSSINCVTSNALTYIGLFKMKQIYLEIFVKETEIQDKTFIEIEMYDVSKLKKANMIIVEESKTKQQLTAKIVHEFKTPLNCISTLGRSIYEKQYNQEEVNEIIQNLTSTSDYTLLLMNDFIRISKNEEINVEIQEIDLENILRFCFNILKSLNKTYGNDNVVSKLNFDRKLYNYKVFSDELRLKQLILNFISNSVKFTKIGNIELSASLNDFNDIVIRVVDTGIGLNDKQKNIILTKNFEKIQVDRKINSMGTGIGLSVCQSIIDKLGYELEIKSSIGKGTEICIIMSNASTEKEEVDTTRYTNINIKSLFGYINTKLKYNQKRTMTRNTTSNNMNNSISHRRINSILSLVDNLDNDPFLHSLTSQQLSMDQLLVVDDNSILRKSLKTQLEKILKELDMSISIIEGTDGVDIISSIVKSESTTNRIKIVFSDESMTFMNGSSAVKILRDMESNSKIPELPIMICITSYEDEWYQTELKNSGFDHVIKKNPGKKELTHLLMEIKSQIDENCQKD